MSGAGDLDRVGVPPFPVAPEERGHGSLAPRRGEEERVGMRGAAAPPLRRSRGGEAFATLKHRARALRANATPEEVALWEVLRGNRLMGWRFRRQHQIGPYIADFACIEARLVVELLGPAHYAEQAQREDRQRTRFLGSAGYQVLEIPNEFVQHQIATVRHQIAQVLSTKIPTRPSRPSRSFAPHRGARDPRPRPLGAAGNGGPPTQL